MQRVRVEQDRFVNESGQQVIFNGINIVHKRRSDGYIQPGIEQLLPAYAAKGFNLIRLGILWDGVEPSPGVYDDAYLDRVHHVIELAEQAGLYVLLDMHQDLFSVKFIDGAPEWATLDGGAPHPEGCTLWYEAYIVSQAVINAADAFWANAPAPDGVGLLDHYEAMWGHLAARFADCRAVIGFEPMNEPFMGRLAREAFGEATMKVREDFPAFDLARPDDISLEERMRFQAIVTERFLAWDKATLMPFYQRMRRAIRKHSDIALATGGNIYCSAFFTSGIERITDESGAIDPQQIYAPHGYDSVVNTERYEAFSRSNVEALYADKRATQERLGLPVIVGEWGCFPDREFANDLIRHMQGILEQYLWGSTYWAHEDGLESNPNYAALERGYPAEVAGILRAYHYDPEARTLRVAYTARAGEVSCFFLPHALRQAASTGEVEWEAEGYWVAVRAREGGPLEVTLEG